MHSFIPDLQINSSVSFHNYENHTVIEACFADTCTKLKVQISCVVVASGMDILLPLCF